MIKRVKRIKLVLIPIYLELVQYFIACCYKVPSLWRFRPKRCERGRNKNNLWFSFKKRKKEGGVDRVHVEGMDASSIFFDKYKALLKKKISISQTAISIYRHCFGCGGIIPIKRIFPFFPLFDVKCTGTFKV